MGRNLIRPPQPPEIKKQFQSLSTRCISSQAIAEMLYPTPEAKCTFQQWFAMMVVRSLNFLKSMMYEEQVGISFKWD
jgi:hypothetical protein